MIRHIPLFKAKLLSFTILLLGCWACDNGYFMDDRTPEWLGGSIYDYLKENNYNYYVRMIDTLNYREVLSKTGSKTLFVVDDEAFERFFADPNNEFGAGKFSDLTLAQIKTIIYSTMINNPQLIELMANVEGPGVGRRLRRTTSLSVVDTIPFLTSEQLPNTPYWSRFKERGGIRMAMDDSKTPMVHLLPQYMQYQKITKNDFKLLTNLDSMVEDGAYVNGKLVVERDITCLNGYVHRLEDLALPLKNMAEIIRQNPDTRLFSSFIERFSAPYYSSSLSSEYQRLYGSDDSVFVKRYFANHSPLSGGLLTDPDGEIVTGSLSYDIGWNLYHPNGYAFTEDMGAIFVPTDDAVRQYFRTGGKFLIERYGSLDSIPLKLVSKLINNHIKSSFIGSVPSRFSSVMNDAQIEMGVTEGDINKVFFGSNGVVYVMNRIYPPVSYVAVSAPTLVNENMKILNWAIEQLQFYAYLLSMDAYFSFVIPTDDALKCYVDPVSLGRSTGAECFSFSFNDRTQQVEATVFSYDIDTQAVGDSLRQASPAEILNRLEDLLDYHTIVGDIEDGKRYYQTKGGGTIRVSGLGEGMSIEGGRQIESGGTTIVTAVYDQTNEGNGKAYRIENSPLLSPFKSVYRVLQEHPEFSSFYNLLAPDDSTGYIEDAGFNIFGNDPTQYGLDLNITFFKPFHYTIYVPTNAAVDRAIANGLPTWEDVLAEGDSLLRDAKTRTLTRFLRYHFQDNSVFLDGSSNTGRYETAAFNPATGRFFKFYLERGNGITLTDNTNRQVRVKTDNAQLYNIMARDYRLNGTDLDKVSQISSSAWAVIHQIDDVLLYGDEIRYVLGE